jgi:hypothetical protein
MRCDAKGRVATLALQRLGQRNDSFPPRRVRGRVVYLPSTMLKRFAHGAISTVFGALFKIAKHLPLAASDCVRPRATIERERHRSCEVGPDRSDYMELTNGRRTLDDHDALNCLADFGAWHDRFHPITDRRCTLLHRIASKEHARTKNIRELMQHCMMIITAPAKISYDHAAISVQRMRAELRCRKRFHD